MPLEINLPHIVHLYLQIVKELQDMTEGHDTQSIVTKTLNIEISHYLWLIRGEMDRIKKDEDL